MSTISAPSIVVDYNRSTTYIYINILFSCKQTCTDVIKKIVYFITTWSIETCHNDKQLKIVGILLSKVDDF